MPYIHYSLFHPLLVVTIIIQRRIREAKEELTAEIRLNTERVSQLTTLLREREQYEKNLDARQKNVVSSHLCCLSLRSV